MGEAGKKKFKEEFTLERFENRMAEILQKSAIYHNKLTHMFISQTQSNIMKAIAMLLIILGHNHILAPQDGSTPLLAFYTVFMYRYFSFYRFL